MSSVTQDAMALEYGGKWETEVSLWEQSVLIVDFQVLSAYTLLNAEYSVQQKISLEVRRSPFVKFIEYDIVMFIV